MKRQAVYLVAPLKVQVREEPLAPPRAGQLLIQTLVSAISPGTELLFYRGQAPTDIPMDENIPALAGPVGYPLKYGYASVGRVVGTGPEAAAGWQDKLVFSFHPHESHFTVSPAKVIPLPPPLQPAPEQAAFLPNMETAVNFVMDGRPVVGERVAIFGQGVVGLLTTALIAQFPLAALVTLDRYPLRRARSLALGAQASLDPVSLAASQLRAALEPDGGGADLTYELSGSPAALDQAIAATGFGGRVVVGSWYGQKRAELNLGSYFHRSRLHLVSSQVSTLAPEWSARWTKSRRLQVAWQMIERLRPGHLITHRFPVTQAAQAFELLDQHPQDAIQVMLTYDE